MKPDNNYRYNRYGYTGAYERNTRTSDSNFQNRYDNSGRNTYNNRFPEDTDGYSDAPSYSDHRDRRHNAYNSDTRRDADAYNYRSSGGYGRQTNEDRYGYYDRNSQSYNDRYTTNTPGRWPEDARRRTSSQNTRNVNPGNYRDRDDDRNPGYAGRDSRDYSGSTYEDRYYDPSDNYNRRDERGYTYRHDEEYEHDNRPLYKGRYSWGNEEEDQTKADYGYYESYPSYGQSDSYNDHERYTGKTGGRSRTDNYGETEYNRSGISRNFW